VVEVSPPAVVVAAAAVVGAAVVGATVVAAAVVAASPTVVAAGVAVLPESSPQAAINNPKASTAGPKCLIFTIDHLSC